MTSKQEKLAAARRKLKEFQGKSKEVEFSKQRVINDILKQKISYETVNKDRPLIASCENSENFPLDIQPNQVKHYVTKKEAETAEDKNNEETTLEYLPNEPNLLKTQSSLNQNLVSGNPGNLPEEVNFDKLASDCANGPKASLIEFDRIKDYNSGSLSNSVMKDKDVVLLERDNLRDNEKTFLQAENPKSAYIESSHLFGYDTPSKSASNEPSLLQEELQRHAQTIAILVQQRNDAQTALTETQGLLNKKLVETEALALQLTHLSTSVNSLNQRLFEAESVIKNLNLEKEETLKKWNETKALTENFQIQLDRKKEEFQEMKRKYEEKNNNCQQLLIALKDSQAQLSFLQLQQRSSESLTSSTTQISELQNENIKLRQKVEELETKLEAENKEKEESSQKFQIYAQQCNSQLTTLNAQLKSFKLEKENLLKENITLSKNLSELEDAKPKNIQSKSSYETEMTGLHDQVKTLSEEQKKLNVDLLKKEEECTCLKSKIEEKDLELRELTGVIKELSEENKKLAREAETPKADERLLATMESDKVAAAKAVSQNQKLKMQVSELEQAFMKVSEEKLELTNQLAHERHVTSELKNMLGKLESENHDHDHSKCQFNHEDQEPLVNDSNELEELKNIVRQLQDDKIELTARLNLYESNDEKGKDNPEEKKNGEQCEDTKLLLQQMKEKVRKTMDEIAVLDEEKEKLEHLVLQLQGETETIGEYIALYQKQRMLLKQRSQEKDSQLLQLSRDKEELKSKLDALDELVQCLLAERENIGIPSGSKLQDSNSFVKNRENTAEKIRALINEIGSTTLISNQSITFEHCSCCSGRLITI